MKKYKIYADTSVYGGVFDEEFAEESKKFFDNAKKGKYVLVISESLLRELAKAPENVQMVLSQIPPENTEFISFDEEVGDLRDEYLRAGILGRSSKADAEHVAFATIAFADFIVSWNFKHIVHFEKINGFQSVNIRLGYQPIRIYSPKEVV